MWNKFIHNIRLRRICVLLILVLVLYLVRSMMSIILWTFIFILLASKLVKLIRKYIKISPTLIVILLYLLIIITLGIIIGIYAPRVFHEAWNSTQMIVNGRNSVEIGFIPPHTQKWIMNLLNQSHLFPQFEKSLELIGKYIASLVEKGAALLIGFLFSFFFMVEYKQVIKFSSRFLDSTYGWFFRDIYYFARIFVDTFGYVLETQFIIALINTSLTTVVLMLMRMPEVILLSIMVFFLSLIPVVGVIISLIPLCLISYAIGGTNYVIYILITIIVIHSLEAYLLNPKFMAAKTHLPIFYTLVVLFVGEHLLGTWGLIVAVPIFVFILTILGVKEVSYNHITLEKDSPLHQKNKRKNQL